MRRSVTTLLALVLAAALGAACDGETTRSAGSETNWLGSCSPDSPCAEGQCLCGVCTDECTELTGCNDGTLICASNQSLAHGKLCADERAAPEGLCLRSCAVGSCPDGNRCEDGACVPEPPPPEPLSCSGDDSCILQNAVGVCDPDGFCAIASCNRDHDDCNDIAADGCEGDFANDTENCDTCGRDCNAERPERAQRMYCSQRSCLIEFCEAGFDDCDEETETGCEVDLLRDEAHCGGCGAACADGQQCVEGVCGP